MDLRSSLRQKAWDTDDDNDDTIDKDNEIFFNQGFTSNVSPRSGSIELSLLRGLSLPPRTKHQKFLFHDQQQQLSTSPTTAQLHHQHQQQQQFQSLPPKMYQRQSSQPSGPTNRRLASRNKSDHHVRIPQSKSFSGVDRTHPYPRDGMTDQTDSSTLVSPFSGINLRWRSETINTGSDTGSIKKPRRPSRKKAVSRAISELQNSVFGDSLPYGAGWMANPVSGRRRLESVGSQTNSKKSSADIEDSDLHQDHHNSFNEPRDQRPGFRSSSVRSEGLQPLNSIMKKDSFSHHPRLQQRVSYNDDYNGPHSHRLPEIHESTHDHHQQMHDDIHQQAAHGFHPQQQQLQQQQHVQPQRHDSRHHRYDSIHQQREIPAEHHEMVSIYSSTPSLYNPNIRLAKDSTTSLRPESPALSQTLSSYNFNNRVRPKRESHPKNMEEFDLSIKNEFERLRKEYDKNETIDQSSYNRFPNKDKDKKLSKNDRSNLKNRPSSVKFNSDPIEDYPSHNDDDYGFIEAYKPSNQKRVGFDPDSGLDLPEGHGSQLKLREDYDNQQKQRKRNHVIFLVIVLVIVAVAVASAVLAVTLGSTNGHAKKTSENYSVVMATMTLKILNRKFQDELLVVGSDTFQSLAAPYSTELDELFLRSNLSSVYSNNKITSFRNGSIYATSSITFLDEGLITSPQDVENVIRSADVARDWKMEDALQLGEFVVCRSCAETKLEYVSVKEKPEVLLLNLDPQVGESKDANSVGEEKSTTDTPKEPSTSNTASTTTHQPLVSTEKVQSSNTTTTTSTTTIVAAAKSTTSETFTNTTTTLGKTTKITPTTEAPNRSQSSSAASSVSEATAAASTSVSNSLSESSSPASTFPPTTTTTTTTTTKSTTPEVRLTTSPNTFSTTSAAAPTDFITEKSENVTDAPTVVRVSSVNATTKDSHVLVTCDIVNPNDWSAVNVLHTSSALSSNAIQTTETIVRLDTSNLYVTATISKLYKDRVRVIYDVSSSRIAIKINITALSCYDDGYVECSLAGRTLSRTSSRGRLEVTTAPSQPRLKIPTELVANRQISDPITCQADVGYPPWNLKLTAQVPGTAGSYVVPVQTDSVVDGCKEYVTLKFARYIPSLTANGTIVNCKLEKGDNSARPQEVKTEQGILLVVSESICRGRADQTKLRHPQNCSLWILCIDQQPHVNSCPRGLCYDTMSGHCGAKSIIIETKDGILNNGLASITCSAVHVNDWSEIYIRRADSTAYTYDVVSVSAQGNITWHDSSLGMRAMATHRFSVVENVLQLWIYVLKCGDAGTYRCSVMQGNGLTMERETQLRVLAKAQPPTLTVPSRAAVEISQPVNITCEANLGQPPATLTLMRKLPNSYTYHTVTATEDTTLVLSPCMQMQRKTFMTSTWALANQTVFRCDVTSSFDNSDLAAFHSVEQEYVELPNDTCKGLGPTLLPHPSDCRHFVQCALSETSVLTCGAGLCFNETSHQCDVLLANRADVTMNLCLGKADGHYLPHPSLCNKYIRCELGKAKIQHCPQSEVYYKDGLCTQFIHLSHCFKKSLE